VKGKEEIEKPEIRLPPAIIPARQAARLNIIRALQYE
jgi:hypothetical protein